MNTKWVYVDESGTPPRQRNAWAGYFALTAVALNDAGAAQAVLRTAFSMLQHRVGTSEADRVVRRGYFHASEDTPVVRRFFLAVMADLNFHCRIAIFDPTCSPPGRTCYDALVTEIFAEMLPPGIPADVMEVTIALRGGQSGITGKGAEFESLFSSVRRHLEDRFPAIAGQMPDKHPVKHIAYRDDSCLQLPDYCGWAVRRWRVANGTQWLSLLRPRGPGWRDDQDNVVLPPRHEALYVTAGHVTGVDFFCGLPGPQT